VRGGYFIGTDKIDRDGALQRIARFTASTDDNNLFGCLILNLRQSAADCQ
jgi:hypothetical protein